MNSGIKMAGGAAVAAGLGTAVFMALRKYPRRGPAVLRIAFAVAVGVGAYWQEKLRQRELANALLASGYMDPDHYAKPEVLATDAEFR